MQFIYNIFQFFKQINTKTQIISIGNLNTGGSGKTPMIHYIATEFFKNKQVLIVTKSYKALLEKPEKVKINLKSAVQIYGDEACLLQKTFSKSVSLEKNNRRIYSNSNYWLWIV